MRQTGCVVSSSAHGPIPTADHGISHHQGNVVRISPSTAFDGYGNMGKRHAVIAHPNIRTYEKIISHYQFARPTRPKLVKNQTTK